jgi:hypothetical protein
MIEMPRIIAQEDVHTRNLNISHQLALIYINAVQSGAFANEFRAQWPHIRVLIGVHSPVSSTFSAPLIRASQPVTVLPPPLKSKNSMTCSQDIQRQLIHFQLHPFFSQI